MWILEQKDQVRGHTAETQTKSGVQPPSCILGDKCPCSSELPPREGTEGRGNPLCSCGDLPANLQRPRRETIKNKKKVPPKVKEVEKGSLKKEEAKGMEEEEDPQGQPRGLP